MSLANIFLSIGLPPRISRPNGTTSPTRIAKPTVYPATRERPEGFRSIRSRPDTAGHREASPPAARGCRSSSRMAARDRGDRSIRGAMDNALDKPRRHILARGTLVIGEDRREIALGEGEPDDFHDCALELRIQALAAGFSGFGAELVCPVQHRFVRYENALVGTLNNLVQHLCTPSIFFT